jgi:hypothetical protein
MLTYATISYGASKVNYHGIFGGRIAQYIIFNTFESRGDFRVTLNVEQIPRK